MNGFKRIRGAAFIRSYLSKPNGNIKSKIKNLSLSQYALLTVPVATFCLGTWQVQRRTWKLNLIKALEERTSADPVDLPDDLNQLSQMEYKKVKVTGRFDHSKELYIGPRSLISDEAEGGSVFSKAPKSGYHVVTPFHLSDRDLTILVNRGWVPRAKLSPATRSGGQIEEEIELVGAIRLNEQRPPFMSKNTGSKQFSYRDLQKMAQLCDTAPVLIDADFRSTVPDGPIGGQTRVSLRNEHLSYIITWYSLSAATFWIWYRRFVQGLKVA